MKVRRIRYRSGKVAWQLDLGMVTQPDGRKKRVQTFFKTQEEAKGALSRAKAQRERHGDASLSLSEADRIRFTAARDQLAAAGATIEQAVAFYLRNQKATREPVSLTVLLERCIDAKQRLGKSSRYLQQFRCSCLSFIRGREHVHAHEIKRSDVQGWVLGNGWSPKTQRVYLGDLRTLFAFGVSEGFTPENPCAGDGPERIHLAATTDAPISTLGVEQSKQLLQAAARVPGKEGEEDFRPLLYYVTLGLFCGIRPAELVRMDRSQVCLKERHAIVEGHQAKTRRRRVVDISENALAWLQIDSTTTGPLTPPNFRRRWARLRVQAGWRPELQALSKGDPTPDSSLPEWPHDVMRHTFASMHYAHHQNESLLKAQMGHSSSEDVLFQHYRALKSRAEAARFWSLSPAI